MSAGCVAQVLHVRTLYEYALDFGTEVVADKHDPQAPHALAAPQRQPDHVQGSFPKRLGVAPVVLGDELVALLTDDQLGIVLQMHGDQVFHGFPAPCSWPEEIERDVLQYRQWIRHTGFDGGRLRSLSQPVLVVTGGRSHPRFADVADRLVEVLPDVRDRPSRSAAICNPPNVTSQTDSPSSSQNSGRARSARSARLAVVCLLRDGGQPVAVLPLRDQPLICLFIASSSARAAALRPRFDGVAIAVMNSGARPRIGINRSGSLPSTTDAGSRLSASPWRTNSITLAASLTS